MAATRRPRPKRSTRACPARPMSKLLASHHPENKPGFPRTTPSARTQADEHPSHTPREELDRDDAAPEDECEAHEATHDDAVDPLEADA